MQVFQVRGDVDLLWAITAGPSVEKWQSPQNPAVFSESNQDIRDNAVQWILSGQHRNHRIWSQYPWRKRETIIHWLCRTYVWGWNGVFGNGSRCVWRGNRSVCHQPVLLPSGPIWNWHPGMRTYLADACRWKSLRNMYSSVAPNYAMLHKAAPIQCCSTVSVEYAPKH